MKYRKKPIVIEAVQWVGNNKQEMSAHMGEYPKVINNRIRILTLEGAMYADVLDYIIKGINGEFYPCKPDIFEKTYDLVMSSGEA